MSTPPSGHISPIATSPALKPTLASPSGHIGSSSIPDIAADVASPDVHKYESQTGCDVLDPDPASTPPPGRIEPSSDAASQDVHKHETQAGRDALDPDIDSSSLKNLNSSPPSVGASKPKFKVGRRLSRTVIRWKDRLELYNDLELVSGEPMDYRSRTKAWNKFVDKLK